MIRLRTRNLTRDSPPFVIAEIGNNHQGSLKNAIELVKTAKFCGADAVKFQKRTNIKLYTKHLYNQLYDNPDSFGETYGKHREALELSLDEFIELKKYTEDLGLEFMCTAFDFDAVDFLEGIGLHSYKIASGDLTSLPLIEYVAKLGKPIFISTGAATLEEVHTAYKTVLEYHDQICIMQCTASYPADYEILNLNVIKTYLEEFPEAIIGYSGHDTGVLATSIARMLGATVFEKHFTMNRAWKGTDHKFSLEPRGLQVVVRDLKRISQILGSHEKQTLDVEKNAKIKMGKSIYYSRDLKAGTVLSERDINIKCPFKEVPASDFKRFIGKKILVDVEEDDALEYSHFKGLS
ncbi:MAG: N-acetylneuraminate synthase family protein [Candidatus Altiarchaeota archaeon]|nr:N-acetylneuraminate synthase family protein [Candidatus Altiarchaeota archaeon]